MPEVRKRCDVYKVRMFCDKCFSQEKLAVGQGEMIAQLPEDANVGQICYLHACNLCGTKQFFDKVYPYMESREIYFGPLIYDDMRKMVMADD